MILTNIIGNGVEFENLNSLVSTLNLDNKVNFCGRLEKSNYVDYIINSDLGIGSLNWSLVNVKVSSALKLREYISCGIPVVYTSYDPDLNDQKFAFEINDNQVSIDRFFYHFPNKLKKLVALKLLILLKKKLSMKIKLKTILNEIE